MVQLSHISPFFWKTRIVSKRSASSIWSNGFISMTNDFSLWKWPQTKNCSTSRSYTWSSNQLTNSAPSLSIIDSAHAPNVNATLVNRSPSHWGNLLYATTCTWRAMPGHGLGKFSNISRLGMASATYYKTGIRQDGRHWATYARRAQKMLFPHRRWV